VSSEVQSRLNRSLADDFSTLDAFGDRQILAVARVAFAAAKATVSVNKHFVKRPTQSVSWLNDPVRFNAAVAAINSVMQLIRPSATLAGGITYQPQFNAAEIVREIATAPPVVPERASRHVRAIVELRNDLGEELLNRGGGAQARMKSRWGSMARYARSN
jgi:hypothetical protein